MISYLNIRIRDVDANDAHVLVEIFRSSVRVVAQRDYSPAQILAWASDDIDIAAWRARDPTKRAYLAEDDIGPVGFAELEPDGHVNMMYVHPRSQGKGVASALLSYLESVARSLDINELRTEASITARPFFEKRGFQLIEQQVVSHRGQDFINYRMKKWLNICVLNRVGG